MALLVFLDPPFAHKLIGSAFADYARLLRTLGLREGAALWASRAGGAGEELLEELFQPEDEADGGLEEAEGVLESPK